MGLVLTFTAAWVLAIILWGVDLMKFFDAFLIGMTLMLLAVTAKVLVRYLPGGKD
ncbi:MAG TPA: hypothetical protein VFZ00_23000 [Solirubrobacter sp.]|nr:hypothetical protein [Solirubrobacter sp.]